MTTVNLSNDKKRENVKANDGQQYVYVVESSKGANLRNVDKDTVKLEGNAADYSIKATAAGVIITSDDKQFKVVATLQRVNERKDLATGELTIEFADGKTLVVERGAEKGQFGKVFLVGADGAKEELSKQGVDADDLFPTEAPTETPTEEPTNPLTEALEGYQAALSDVDAKESAIGELLEVEDYDAADNATNVAEQTAAVADKQSDVDGFISDLYAARADSVGSYAGNNYSDLDDVTDIDSGTKLTDANVSLIVAKALADVNADLDAKELLFNLKQAENDLAKHVAANGDDKALAKALNDAIVAYLNGDGSDSVAEDLADIIAAYNTELVKPTADQDWSEVVDAAADAFEVTKDADGKVTSVQLANGGTAVDLADASSSLITALKNLAVAADDRKALNVDVDVDESGSAAYLFNDDLLGARYNLALDLQADRADQLKAISDAEAELAEEQALLDALTALVAEYDSAVKVMDAAKATLEDLGVDELVEIADGDNAGVTNTAELFLFSPTAEKQEIILTLESNDQIFIGSGYTLNTEADFSKNQGDVSALEVFFVQNGINTDVYVEQSAFGSNAASQEVHKITLLGVDAASLTLSADGFISVAA